MVKFLISRPIAITMTYIAILVLGVVATFQLPISLMPDINIPKMTVQVSGNNLSARELESTVVKPLRQSLLQVSHLEDIRSETRDGYATVNLQFDYGTETDLTFIEVNEKIDQAMNNLPKGIGRPHVLKASATDIPVFYLNITLKNDTVSLAATNDLFPVSQKFVELSNFTARVIKKRIEQLEEVAIVDMTGRVFPELLIIPDLQKMSALGISHAQLEQSITKMNLTLDNLLIRDGQYQYNIRFATSLQNKKDIEDIYLKIEGRLLQLKDLATVVEHPQKRRGLATSGGKNALVLAVIKQSDARMRDLKEALQGMIGQLRSEYPSIDFTVTRDQTALLDYSIDNMAQSLVWGTFFAFVIMFFFLKDIKSPLLIGITLPTSLLVSLLSFHIAGLSINIISLSGLVLGIGIMIDNSIIVIDNIAQHFERGSSLTQACISGTNEVFRPMLSSVLTTCVVFIPLIFISGIAGALFYDQAISITIGLFVSLGVSLTLLPVYFKLFYQKKTTSNSKVSALPSWLKLINRIDYEEIYEKGFRYTMRHQGTLWAVVLLMIAGIPWLYVQFDKERLPTLTKDEALLQVDWNQNIHVKENNFRGQQLIGSLNEYLAQNTLLAGHQQFLLGHYEELSSAESLIYLKAKSPEHLRNVMEHVPDFMAENYPGANYGFKEAGNIFNLIFSEDEPPLVAHLRPLEVNRKTNFYLNGLMEKLNQSLDSHPLQPIPWQEYVLVKTDPVKLLAYDVTFESLLRKIKSAFRENEIMVITENQTFTPVVLGGKTQRIQEILNHTQVENKAGELIPVRSLISETRGFGRKKIIAGKTGEFFPVNLLLTTEEEDLVMDKVRQVVAEGNHFEVSFSGSLFSNRELVKELSLILSISLLLLYFILASQFESLTLPLIVLLEVPIDIFGAFLVLYLFGASINLMSLIGIIVMSGIIINDSILKIDTVNQLRSQGYSLLKALAVAGQRRLKPILMTSLTTILALLPLLFTNGLGADLQKPLALAIIGGMTVGTLVSLYFIPLCYYYLNLKTKQTV